MSGTDIRQFRPLKPDWENPSLATGEQMTNEYPTWTSDGCDTVRIRHCDPQMRGACYYPFNGWMAFNTHAFSHRYLTFMGILNHEVMHKVLHKTIDFNATRDFDNIWIDHIHDSEWMNDWE